MKRVLWLVPLLLLLACGPTTSDLPPTDATAGGNTAVSPTTNTDEATQETDTDSTGPSTADLADFVPATTPDEAAQVRAQDWRKGSTDPAVVLIEYGDFQ